MKTFYSHTFTGRNNLEAMLALVKARPTDRIMDFPSLIDLYEMLSLPEILLNTNLWVDIDGNLAGFAILTWDETSCNLIFEAAPHASERDLYTQIMTWGEQTARYAYKISAGVLVLETRCRTDDLARISILEQYGFVEQPMGALQMVRPLDEFIPEPALPPGFSIRSLLGVQEVEAWVALHRAAFGTQNMTVEYRRAMLNVPNYDSELDLVAVATGGDLSGYCVGSISQEENLLTGQKVGFTDPVATHPSYQRQGLARALLLTALNRLKKRGMLTARLGTTTENIAMQRAAQSVGFRELSRSITFSKAIPNNHQIAGTIA